MKESLITQNPWLKDPLMRTKFWWISAKTSSAIEGIHKPFETPPDEIKHLFPEYQKTKQK